MFRTANFWQAVSAKSISLEYLLSLFVLEVERIALQTQKNSPETLWGRANSLQSNGFQ